MLTCSIFVVVAVACGSELFLYKNLKPFYKFRVPFCPLVQEETSIWSEMSQNESFDMEKMVNVLSSIPFSSLSAK